MADVKCPRCGRAIIEKDGRFGKFLGCSGYPSCTTVKNKFGFSDQMTRDARKWAHVAFDKIWQGEEKAQDRSDLRTKAYQELALFMELDGDECHMEGFDSEQCEVVIRWVKNGFGEGGSDAK